MINKVVANASLTKNPSLKRGILLQTNNKKKKYMHMKQK